jgi:hypothetical protein
MTQGVIYYNKGRKCISRIIVSMMTMRRHYKGPITLFLEDGGMGKENMDRLAHDVKKELDVDVIIDQNDDTTTYVRAVELSLKSPYDLTVWMDADTVILGSFDELFEEAKTHDFVIPHFAGWNSNGGAIGGRIRNLTSVCPQYIQAALDYGPAINCGVYAWKKGSPFLPEWLVISKGAEATKTFIPDEKSCQVLLPQYNVKIMPQKFNVSVVHDRGTTDARVVHFHGRKHCKEYPKCDIWIEWFIKALRDDVCHIRNYIGREFGDKRLTHFLKGEMQRAETVAIINKILASAPGTYDLSKHNPLVKPCGGNQLEKDFHNIDNEVITGKEAEMWDDEVREIEAKATESPAVAKGIEVDLAKDKSSDETPVDPSLVTVVTACDTKYVEQLAVTFPTWVKYKDILKYKMIVFVNGMEINDKRLDFLRHDNVKLIPWSMPEAESHREEMLSAFILGAARHVETKYWLKLDADSYATDNNPLIVNWMITVVFCGHRWGYSWTEHIKALDKWAASNPKLVNSPLWGKPMYEKEHDKGRKYFHPTKRTISFIQLQETAFTKKCADLAGGKKLPVPSHDTYLYYMADRMGLPWRSSNFKARRGFTQGKGVDGLKEAIGNLGVV